MAMRWVLRVAMAWPLQRRKALRGLRVRRYHRVSHTQKRGGKQRSAGAAGGAARGICAATLGRSSTQLRPEKLEKMASQEPGRVARDSMGRQWRAMGAVGAL